MLIQLQELVGVRAFDALDFSPGAADMPDHQQVCRFRLDGVLYVAAEDPEDGYRSSLHDLEIDTTNQIANVFAPIIVRCQHLYLGEDGSHDYSSGVLQAVELMSGALVFEVGTTTYDRWYPSFIAHFYPEAMAVAQQFAAQLPLNSLNRQKFRKF